MGEPEFILQPFLDCMAPVSTVEFFAGLGGWHEGLRVAQKSTRALIDFDEKVTAATASRLNTEVLSPASFWKKAVADMITTPVVVCGKTSYRLVVQTIGLLNTLVGFASPPCQPWSASGNGEGLSGDNGQSFKQLFEDAADLGLWALCCENVPGITRHKDFQALKSFAADIRLPFGL